MHNGNTILAVRLPAAVDSAITTVAKQQFTTRPEYVRRVLRERLVQDGGLKAPEPVRAA